MAIQRLEVCLEVQSKKPLILISIKHVPLSARRTMRTVDDFSINYNKPIQGWVVELIEATPIERSSQARRR
jgi:hypothetical protein